MDFGLSVKTQYFILGCCLLSVDAFAKVIYGIEHIPDVTQFENYPVDVQVGSFTSENHAKKIMRTIRIKTHYQPYGEFKSEQFKVSVFFKVVDTFF